MNYEFEMDLVFNINKLKRLYSEKTKDLQAELKTFTEKDAKELDNHISKFSFSLNKKCRDFFFDKAEMVSSKNFKDEIDELFKFFNFKNEDVDKLVSKKIDEFRKEDVLLKINDMKDAEIKEIFNDKKMRYFINNKYMLKLVNVMVQVDRYFKETILMFNRESSSYVGGLLSELEAYGFNNLIKDIAKRSSELSQLSEKIIELRARRNIYEHNDGIINEDYVSRVKSADKKNIGKLLITSPDYISKSYETTLSFCIIATIIVMEKLGKKINKEKLLSLIDETKNFTNEMQMISYFKF